jgi:hypothetical protein
MKRFPNCEVTRKDKKIPLEENQSKITFENPKRLEIRILNVDGCAITEGLRCDYAMTSDMVKEEFYIELKGRDIKHAFAQIETTIQSISANVKEEPKFCFVISTRCPLSGPEIQKMQKMMMKKYKAILVVKNRVHSHTIEPSS